MLNTVRCCPALLFAGNIKATTPIAFTTTLLVWALMSFGRGFQAAGQAAATLDSIRWGSDYLLKVHRAAPDANQSMLVTRVSARCRCLVGCGKGHGVGLGCNLARSYDLGQKLPDVSFRTKPGPEPCLAQRSPARPAIHLDLPVLTLPASRLKFPPSRKWRRLAT